MDGRERSQHVRHRRERQQLRPVEQHIEVRQIERVVVGDTEVPKLDAALLLQHQPGHEVGVVLHLGEDDGIALVQVGASPRVGDEVDGLGDVLREHQPARRRCTDERSDLASRLFVALGGLRRDLVHAAVHVRVVRVVDVVHRIEHRLGLLGRRGRIEVHDPLAVHLLLQQREVLLDPCDVERPAHARSTRLCGSIG